MNKTGGGAGLASRWTEPVDSATENNRIKSKGMNQKLSPGSGMQTQESLSLEACSAECVQFPLCVEEQRVGTTE